MERVLAPLVALIVPPRCAACGAGTRAGAPPVCGACRRALPWLGDDVCARCALPRPCGARCPAARAAFAASWAPLAFSGSARELVHALKFAGARPLADLMAAQMAACAPPGLLGPPRAAGGRGPARPGPGPPESAHAWTPAAYAGTRVPHAGMPVAYAWTPVGPVLVAVPCHPARRRARGYDQAALLAAALARRTGLPLAAPLRRLGRAGDRQAGASRAARTRSGRIALELRGVPPPAVLLVDDVHTTGATLDAAARALRAAGTTHVAALTWARTPAR